VKGVNGKKAAEGKKKLIHSHFRDIKKILKEGAIPLRGKFQI